MTDPHQVMPRWERLEYEDAIAALRSLVGDRDIHPADCPICVALNGLTGPAIDLERLADLRRHHEYGCGECATWMSWPHRSRERAKP